MTRRTGSSMLFRIAVAAGAASLAVALLMGLLSCSKDKREERGAAASEIKWLTSYDEALAAARDDNLPVMVDFYTDWCGWCKKLDAETYVDTQVISMSASFVSLKIDADAAREIATRYGITGFPTILFLDPAGNEIHRVVGYRPPPQFVLEMNRAIEAFRATS
ncbi:MAG: thioredoxin domain-containing protein [bacterium]